MRDSFIETICCLLGMVIIEILLIIGIIFTIMLGEYIFTALIIAMVVSTISPIRNLLSDF